MELEAVLAETDSGSTGIFFGWKNAKQANKLSTMHKI